MNPLYALRRSSQEAEVTRNSAPTPEKRIYTRSHQGGWGRNWSFMAGSGTENRRIYGHQPQLPRVGDEFHPAMQSGGHGIFRVTKVEYCVDPPDMFFADVEFVGYEGISK